MKYFVFILLSTLFVLWSSLQSQAQVPLSDQHAIFYMARTSCYGKCPVYTVTVFDNGNVHYNGIAHTPLKGEYIGHIEQKSIQMIFNSAINAQYFELSTTYPKQQPGILDFPTCITHIKYKGQQKTIYNRHEAPLKLVQFEHLIDEMIKKVKLQAKTN